MRGVARAIAPSDLDSSAAAGAAAALALALLTGALAARSIQAAVTIVLLVLLLAVRLRSRGAGLVVMWGYWLLAPFARRLLDLTVGTPGADPLSVLPFLATLMLAVMELRENRLNRRARAILGVAALGLMLGVPVGLVVDPAAASFAALAYGAGLSAFVLGWGDGVRPGQGQSLQRTLAVALVPLAVYAILQYFLPLSAWDANWVESSGLKSLGAPEEDRIRVFSTLNAPFTFAIVVAVGIVLGLGVKRALALRLPALLPLVLALALTFVRSAWLALVVGLVVFVFSARGRAAGQVGAVVAISLVGLLIVGSGSATTGAFTERVLSLGSPEEDVSAQSRLRTTNRLLPESASRPLGAGIGQAGLAAGLEDSGEGEALTVDAGYLSLAYQSGPFALLLVLVALVASTVSAARALGRGPPEERQARAALLAALTMLLVALATADAFFGLPGAILWYLCGLAVASAARGAEGRAGRREPDRPAAGG